MSKIGSFVGGFGVGMKMVNDAEDRKRRNEMEDRRFKIEMERAEREKARADEEDAYRRDLAAAGQTMTNGTSGVGGVATGSQQDAMLAQQNMRGEGGGSGGNQPVSGGFGIMRDAALRHGRVADAAQFSNIQAQENTRGQENEWRNGRQALMEEYQKTGKTRQDALNFYKAVGQHDFKYGKAQLGDLAKVDDAAEKMRKEGVFDALQHYWATGDLAGTLDKFDATGDKRIDRNSVQTSIVKDKLTGVDTPIITGKYQDGQTFRFDPERLAHMVGGYEGYMASRKEAIDAADKAADNKRADRQLDLTERHYKNQDAAAAARAKEGAGSSGKGGGFKDLSADDIKSSFTTYRDVIKPASGVGGKSSVTKEATVDTESLANFRAWARSKGYTDMNMALRDWDAEGRPRANAPAQAQRQQAPADRRPLSEIFR